MKKATKNEIQQVHKALETADYLHGGEINVKQQKRFDQILRGTSAFLDTAEIIFVDQNKGEIPRLFVGGHMTVSAAEGTATGVVSKPTFGKLTYDCKKMQTAFDITHEWMINNVEQESFKGTIMDVFFKQFSKDFSHIAVNGDSASGDVYINAFDGFKKLSNACHILDVNGKEIDRSVFLGAFKTMPYEFRAQKKALRFLANSVLQADWVEFLGDRATGLGDDAVRGQATNPHGIPLILCDEISDSLAVPYTSATHGIITSTLPDTWTTTATANAITIAIEIAGAVGVDRALVIPTGLWTATQLAANLNAQLVVLGDAEVFTTDGRGHLRLKTVNTGAADSIEIKAVANHVYTLMGFTAGKISGLVAGAGNTVPQGTYMWLTEPNNFIIPIVKGVRSTYEYKPRTDLWEFTMYNEACGLIRNEGATVRVDNIKLKDLA